MNDGFRRFVEGRGQFVDDLRLPNMLFLKVLRSPYARARLIKVQGGINGSELQADLVSVGEGAEGAGTGVGYPVLASDYVSFVGQPVAAVVGEEAYAAEDLMDEIEVEYDPLRPVIEPEDSLRSEPIHPGAKSNIISSVQLGKDFDLQDAPVVLEEEFVNERVCPNPIEPRGLAVHFDGIRLTVWASTQSVHSWKEGICECMALPPERVRVIQMDTGGAFGCKGDIYPEYVIACHASLKTGRPVKWVETRSEHLMATHQGRGARCRIKVYADRTGVVLGLKADLLVDGGAYPAGVGAWAPGWIASQLTGPYTVRHAYVTAKAVYTNKAPLGPYRGAGRPEAAYFVERMMDLLADELGIDPVEVRLRNASSEAFVSPLGLRIEPFRPFLESAIHEMNYLERAKKANVGFSCFVLIPAVSPGESARIAIAGGRVKVWLGGCVQGQGHDIFLRMLVREELGVPDSCVGVERGDTDQLKEGIGSWGSRTAIVGSAALIEACRKIKEEAKIKLGKYTPETLLEHEFDVSIFHHQRDRLNSFGANIVSASVNELDGVTIDECVSYYDVGRALNPAMVESQIMGGAAQGIGQLLFEQAKYNEEGQLLSATFADSGIPNALHMPKFVIKLANISSTNQAKGVGESPTIGVPPAAIRAMEKAIGRKLTKTPVPQ